MVAGRDRCWDVAEAVLLTSPADLAVDRRPLVTSRSGGFPPHVTKMTYRRLTLA